MGDIFDNSFEQHLGDVVNKQAEALHPTTKGDPRVRRRSLKAEGTTFIHSEIGSYGIEHALGPDGRDTTEKGVFKITADVSEPNRAGSAFIQTNRQEPIARGGELRQEATDLMKRYLGLAP